MTNLRKIFLSFLLISALPAMSDTDHGDHLGSANWITDAFGDPVQYIHYAPYGELIANQQTIGVFLKIFSEIFFFLSRN